MLDTIAHELTPDTTLGDIVDAAHDLGWGDNLGELNLADLALALFGEAPAPAASPSPEPEQLSEADDDAADDDDDDEAADDGEEEEEEAVEEEAPAKGRGRKAAKAEPAAAPRKQSSLDRALDRIDKALAARGRKTKPAPAKATSKKVAGKKAAPAPAPAKGKAAPPKGRARPAPVVEEDEDDDTDAMSLDQAAKLLVPLVRKLKEATMQDLEEQTKMGRRKLRFHIGQLVKHGRLKRHGMGRGTCYTVK